MVVTPVSGMSAVVIEPWLALLFVAVSSGTVVALLRFMESGIKWINANRVSIEDELEKMATAYQRMNDIVTLGYADRVILFVGHNSGGIPRLGSPFYVTMIHQITAPRVITGEYKDLAVDAEYVKMLLEAMRNTAVHIDVANMPQCQLKDYYVAEGVTESVVEYLCVKSNALYYISYATHNPEGFEHTATTKASLLVNAVRNALAK